MYILKIAQETYYFVQLIYAKKMRKIINFKKQNKKIIFSLF